MKIASTIGIFLVALWLGTVTFVEAADGQESEDPLTDIQKTVEGIQSIFGGGDDSKEVPEDAPLNTPAGTESAGTGRTARGLKEALLIGIKAAVNRAGEEGGFYQNPDIRIMLPEKLQAADAVVRQLGGDELAQALVLKMNRAAEKAAPEARAIFVDAVKSVTITDAQEILTGGDTAATRYLEETTSESLKSSFYPIIKSTMEEIGAVKVYNDYLGEFKSNPFMQMVNLDLSRYVTAESIDGLFLLVAEEERKIRENPAARVTDLLKSVFGNAGE